MEKIKCYCGHTDYCDCGPLELLARTAMQELKDVISEMIKNGGTEEDLFAVVSHIDNWGIEKEKMQIINAHTKAYLIGEDDIILEDANKASEQYYNQTYKL